MPWLAAALLPDQAVLDVVERLRPQTIIVIRRIQLLIASSDLQRPIRLAPIRFRQWPIPNHQPFSPFEILPVNRKDFDNQRSLNYGIEVALIHSQRIIHTNEGAEVRSLPLWTGRDRK